MNYAYYGIVALAVALEIGAAVSIARGAGVVVDGQNIIDAATGQPLRGFQTNWHLPDSLATIETGMDAMINNFGLKGFTMDIGWNEIESSPGTYSFNPRYDAILDMAAARGLKVNIVLTAHYTPDWVYQQGIDVRNKDPQGQSQNGLWLNFSPSSPAALQWQGEFQKKAIEYYKSKPAVMGFHLTNELSFGQGDWLDYSTHAQAAWDQWRTARGQTTTSMPLPSESTSRPEDWQDWLIFRQDTLNKYFNTTYDIAKQALNPSDQKLIFHRHLWYNASDAYAALHGLYLDPNQSKGDVTGGNVYWLNETMAGMLQSWQKPIFLTETNLPALSNNSPVTPGEVNTTFLTQFFQGAQNQTVYQFSSVDYYPMRNSDFTPHPAFVQFKAMAEKIDLITEEDLSAPRQVGYLWPRNYAAVNSDAHWNVQSLYNEMGREGRRLGQSPVIVFPSFLDPSSDIQLSSDLKLMYALRDFGYDQAALNSTMLRDWVSAGGTLVIELDNTGALPSWLSSVSTASTSRSEFSINSSSPFGAQPDLSRGDGGWHITGLDVVWGTWDRLFFQPVQNAVGYENFGSGKVVIIGTNAIAGDFNPVAGLNSFVLGDEGLSHLFEYYRLGHNALVVPLDVNVGGMVSIPLDWLDENLFQSFLMDMQTGVFTSIDGTLLSGKYTFDVPSGNLLMITVPEPSTAGAMLMLCVLASRMRRTR